MGDGSVTCFDLVSEPFGYLSNWYDSPFELNWLQFSCVEHYMMYCKAMLFWDSATALGILATSDPAEMKHLGRSVRNYVDSRWAAVRYGVVKRGVLAKFEQNPELRNEFLSTDGEFAECTKNDLVWGIGLDRQDPDRWDRTKWRGQNLLGFALQEVYTELKW